MPLFILGRSDGDLALVAPDRRHLNEKKIAAHRTSTVLILPRLLGEVMFFVSDRTLLCLFQAQKDPRPDLTQVTPYILRKRSNDEEPLRGVLPHVQHCDYSYCQAAEN